MASKKMLQNEIRVRFLDEISKYYNDKGEEVLRTASNEIAIPTLDSEGNEEWIVLTFKVPTGSRDGDAYDGYSVAEGYALDQAEKAEKAAKAKADKERKIAQDKRDREARAKARAEHKGDK